MSLGMFFMVLMGVVNLSSLIFVLRWMSLPNDRYDELLERLAKGGEIV